MNRMQTQENIPTFLLDLVIIIFSGYFIAVTVQFPGEFNPLGFTGQYFININHKIFIVLDRTLFYNIYWPFLSGFITQNSAMVSVLLFKEYSFRWRVPIL